MRSKEEKLLLGEHSGKLKERDYETQTKIIYHHQCDLAAQFPPPAKCNHADLIFRRLVCQSVLAIRLAAHWIFYLKYLRSLGGGALLVHIRSCVICEDDSPSPINNPAGTQRNETLFLAFSASLEPYCLTPHPAL